MKTSLLLSVLFIFVGCATNEKIIEAHRIQNQAVENLNSNYSKLIDSTLKTYELQTNDDFGLIRDLFIQQDSDNRAEAERVYRDKISARDAEIEKVNDSKELIEKDYKIYQNLKEALGGQ